MRPERGEVVRMMDWNNMQGWGWAGWLVAILIALVIVALIVGLVVWAVRSSGSSGAQGSRRRVEHDRGDRSAPERMRAARYDSGDRAHPHTAVDGVETQPYPAHDQSAGVHGQPYAGQGQSGTAPAQVYEGSAHGAPRSMDSPRDILDRRFAAGEISEAEYSRARSLIESRAPGT